MEIRFDDRTHTYMINGELADTSVTQLLHKHKLAPSYDGIDENVLKRKADYGTKIHKDIEDYINEGKEPTTECGISFKKYANENLNSALAEQLIGIEFSNNLRICGCVDLIGYNKDDELIIADHKTYANMTNEKKQLVAWQLSLYDYMLRKVKVVNGVKLKYTGAKKFYIFWYRKDGSMETIGVDKISDFEIESLLDAECRNEIYTPRNLIITKELEMELIESELKLAQIELEKKELETQVAKNREQIKTLMEQQKIMNWESPNGVIKISYKPEYSRDGLDTKLLKKEQPKIFSKYYKPTKVKASIIVKTNTEKYEQLEAMKNDLLDI